MTGFIAAVDARTQLAGQNRMELLLFRLRGEQRFGINVFKVREVIQCPRLTVIPESNPAICGVANIRGKTLSVIDLGLAIGMPPIQSIENTFLVIAEYNRRVQGFLVDSVDSIVNHTWESILTPPESGVEKSYLTAVTHVDKEIVGILDVERVMVELLGAHMEVSDAALDAHGVSDLARDLVLIIDDSKVARNQVKHTIEQIGARALVACDGLEGWELLNAWSSNNTEEWQQLAVVISDIEMPRMDGYTLTARIRDSVTLNHLRLLLHTSMSGSFNESMVDQVGASEFIPKFNPDELSEIVSRHINEVQELPFGTESAASAA